MLPKSSLHQYVELVRRHVLQNRRPILLAGWAIALAFIVFIWTLFASLPGRDELRNLGEMPQATTLYDIHNRPVFTIFKEYRIEVPLSRVSPHLRKAIVAFEDQRFEEHQGIDPFRIMGAAWTDLRLGRAEQGASTITQQLARQSFLTREKRLWRKFREIALATRIEGMYSKDEILQFYLNKVYFGDGLYGAEAAARGYFGKSASDLTLAEAALLAGVVNAPSVNAPTVSLARAVARRRLVLNAMYDAEDHHEGGVRRRLAAGRRAARCAPARRAARAVLQGRSAAAAGEAIWMGASFRRRSESLHNDRPGDAACG